MDIFVTGATGFVGSATARQLIAAGHTVSGLTRSEEGAAQLEAAGVRPVLGSLEDPAGIAAAAARSDGVVHTAFDHTFTDMAAAARADLAVVEAVGEALAGRGAGFVVTSAVGLHPRPGGTILETDRGESSGRLASEAATLALAERGVRAVVLRLPQVHGVGDRAGFVPRVRDAVRAAGVATYVGDGANAWPAVHVDDVAALYAQAVTDPVVPAGTVLHGVAEEGIAFRDLAEALAGRLGLPTASVTPEQAAEQYGWLAHFVGLDSRTSSAATRELTGWTPTGPSLLDDLAAYVA